MRKLWIVLSAILMTVSIIGMFMGFFSLLYFFCGASILIGSVCIFSVNYPLLKSLTNKKKIDQNFANKYIILTQIGALFLAIGLWLRFDGFELDAAYPPNRHAQVLSVITIVLITVIIIGIASTTCTKFAKRT